jgi:hypothetical protein
MAYLAPPKSLDIIMHYFVPGSGDIALPPSLTTILNNLAFNEYLIRGNLNGSYTFSAYVYNPGTGQREQYYDCYNVIPGDWLADDPTGYTWKVTKLLNVADAPNPGNNTGGGVFYAIMTDVDNYNAGLDPGGTYFGSPAFVDSETIVFTIVVFCCVYAKQ